MTFNSKTLKALVASTLIATATTSVQAEDGDWSGFYGGVSFGIGSLDPNMAGLSDSYSQLGLHAGFYHDMGDFVLGAELEHSKMDLGFGILGGSGDVTRFKLKGGFDLGQVLPYVVVGASRLSVPGLSDGFTSYGVGMDYKLNDTMRVGAEYLIDSSNGTFATTGAEVDLSAINLRLSIGF